MIIKIRKIGLFVVANLVAMVFFAPLSQAEKSFEQPDILSEGGRIFVERCVLCHGNHGAGDGYMPLVVKNYPRTNLLNQENSGLVEELKKQIRWGGTKGEMHQKSPPWDEELNSYELEAVSRFVVALQKSPINARRSIDMHLTSKPIDIETGRLVYQTRCASCHGISGQGDGPMEAIVTNPPPFNLLQSNMSYPAMHTIIAEGGIALGRSGQMPPWKQELSQVQIDSVIKYIDQMKP